MKKTLLNVAVVLPILAAAFFFGVRYGDGERRTGGREFSLGLTSSLSQSDHVLAVPYLMQWNDKTKKLVFDGRPISHNTMTLRMGNCGFVYPVPPTNDQPDEYSFHVSPCMGSDDAHDSTGVSNCHGHLQYLVEWDDQGQDFVYHGQRGRLVGSSYVLFSNQSRPSRYPSPWEATLPGCNTIASWSRQSLIPNP